MKLEVAVKSDQNTYWVATIITTCGQLLLLRYDGYGEDRKADFWCDILTADLHPIGWCQQNNRILKVPEGTVLCAQAWERTRGCCFPVGARQAACGAGGVQVLLLWGQAEVICCVFLKSHDRGLWLP